VWLARDLGLGDLGRGRGQGGVAWSSRPCRQVDRRRGLGGLDVKWIASIFGEGEARRCDERAVRWKNRYNPKLVNETYSGAFHKLFNFLLIKTEESIESKVDLFVYTCEN
jgi:hypothetical protein